MNRRDAAVALLALGSAPLTSFAQPAQKVRRIGYLSLGVASTGTQQYWRDPLRRAGCEEGKNLVIEWRFAEGQVGRLSERTQAARPYPAISTWSQLSSA